VALLVEEEAQLFRVDLCSTGSASQYRGPDFRKPFARHFRDGYAKNTTRPNDFPVYSGQYSTFSYLDETVHAVEHMLDRLGVSAGSYYESVRSLFFHRPYQLMPVRAMSFLYVRGLVRGDHHRDELLGLCREAGVSVADLQCETKSTPDLFARVLSGDSLDPYAATAAVATALRRHATFRRLLAEKVGLGGQATRELGNLYSAALPAWIAAGFEEAAERGLPLVGSNMVAVGYGSGDAAEAIPFSPVDGWQTAAARIGVTAALKPALNLEQHQYEALHDHRELCDLTHEPHQQFVITRIGTAYEPGFQDLGVEYYEYVS
jgi:hydroxymethylglutaryl-CoA synthase